MQRQKISDKYHWFLPQIISHLVWLYALFNLSLREAEEVMLEHQVDVSYDSIRRWTVKFGPLIAHTLRRRPRPGDVWHLDEVVLKIAGRSSYSSSHMSQRSAPDQSSPRRYTSCSQRSWSSSYSKSFRFLPPVCGNFSNDETH
ncbi:hypothetical protein P775_21010 [Puniceibacterium antarcticum]|uniref:DDE domain-containing protein n=1 Tax=Puniceibacterium antarcticum TaxID=1206336 RepID=A0A2G8R9E3_9RHOB|nr:hypothetical protein [Puniceibacterium antarcticum]PIL18180.1 hypothetical protein P775_21010 [Puniceibacterium antarcticum]